MKRSLIILVCLIWGVANAQNVGISDDESHTADPSAVLDVKSTTKGMLVPRVTSVQRGQIDSPATGLLVFDTDSAAFFFFNGATWLDLSSSESEFWNTDGTGVNMLDPNLNVGIGTNAGDAKLEVKGDGSGGTGEILFAVRNANGDTIFAVYDGGVRILVDDTPDKPVSNRGGFAVGGVSSGKGITNEYLRITPDSVRIYVVETASKPVSNRGGFAVGGVSSGKESIVNEYLYISPDSIRMYVDDSPTKPVSNRGGFAVGGVSSGKGITNEYLRVTPDSVRIYTDTASSKGSHGGFAVGGLNTNKGAASQFMTMTKDNYFIGLGAGLNNNNGVYNSFLGYQTGYNNYNGRANVFLGYNAGYSNTGGGWNVFIGSECGEYNTTGIHNVFLGEQTGRYNTKGKDNTFLGRLSGKNNTTGSYNVFVGEQAGLNNTTGEHNIVVGTVAGANLIGGSRNVFMGDSAGCHNTYGARNIYIGERAGESDSIGFQNIYIGYNAGRYAQSPLRLYNANYWNVVIGNQAGMNLTGNTSATFVGNQSGMNCTNADGCSFFGAGSGKNNTGEKNTFVGWRAGNQNSSGINNCFFGAEAGINANGTGNVYLGQRAGEQMASGDHNVCVGSGAGENGTYGNNNVYVGFTTAWKNSGSGNVFIGNGVAYSTSATTYSNKLWIDNSATTEPLIEGDFSSDALIVNGSFNATENTVVGGVFTANDNMILNSGTYFRIASAPGSGTYPSKFVYQHLTGSTAKSDAFAIYDALWVTDNAFLDESISVGEDLTVEGDEVYYPGIKNLKIYNRIPLYINSVNGRIGTDGSSIRFKKNVLDMENVDWLFKLRPVNFVYKEDESETKRYGLIAEEVEQINKLMVAYDENGEPFTVTYNELISPMLKAIQDQQKLIEELQKRIEQLENK